MFESMKSEHRGTLSRRTLEKRFIRLDSEIALGVYCLQELNLHKGEEETDS
jgi:hypothetical protein